MSDPSKQTLDSEDPKDFFDPQYWSSVSGLAAMLNEGPKTGISPNSIRHYIRNAAANGLEETDCIRFIGTKPIIYVPRFMSWLTSRKQAKPMPLDESRAGAK
jgi:hypothetical protein